MAVFYPPFSSISRLNRAGIRHACQREAFVPKPDKSLLRTYFKYDDAPQFGLHRAEIVSTELGREGDKERIADDAAQVHELQNTVPHTWPRKPSGMSAEFFRRQVRNVRKNPLQSELIRATYTAVHKDFEKN